MEIVLIEQNRKFSFLPLTPTWFLQIDTDQGVFVAKFPEGELPGNKLFTVGAKQGISADIAVSWADHTEEIYDIQAIQSCTYYEWCWQNYVETTCDGNGKCWTESKLEWTTCTEWGTQNVKITNEKYKRSYNLDFLNPQNNTDYYGHFAGQQDNLQRELAREPLSACR